MVRPEPTSPVNDLLYSLRELGSRVRRFPEKIAASSKASLISISESGVPAVNYGRLAPVRAGRPIGGEIKLIHLRKAFPECFDNFNLIYLVSSALPAQVEEVVRAAKSKGAKLVWNQNGVAYPGCYGDFYTWFNRRMATLRNQADFIINQSEFSRISAERYLGSSTVPSGILFNPVDTKVFSPRMKSLPDGPWRILAAGTSHALYRTKSAIDTLRELLSRGHDVQLTIAGEFRWKGAEVQVREAMRGLERRVTILPPFGQEEAPEIYRAAHLLLHTKYNDPCPTVPIEAMACGLPVVGTRSGGMSELVSDSCGMLVPIEQGWSRDLAGDPGFLADAVECIMENHVVMTEAARSHAVRAFEVGAWLERHREILRGVASR
jgi:glycosyltransferase involved in cell wall biosynthesis